MHLSFNIPKYKIVFGTKRENDTGFEMTGSNIRPKSELHEDLEDLLVRDAILAHKHPKIRLRQDYWRKRLDVGIRVGKQRRLLERQARQEAEPGSSNAADDEDDIVKALSPVISIYHNGFIAQLKPPDFTPSGISIFRCMSTNTLILRGRQKKKDDQGVISRRSFTWRFVIPDYQVDPDSVTLGVTNDGLLVLYSPHNVVAAPVNIRTRRKTPKTNPKPQLATTSANVDVIIEEMVLALD